MSIISLSTFTDMSGAATPSSGILIGLDTLDGKLKQKDSSGVVTEIGSGSGTGTSGTSGTSGISGSSGTSGAIGVSGVDGGNTLRWIYGDKNTSNEFELDVADFTSSTNTVGINDSSQSGDASSWLQGLADYVGLFPGACYLKITELNNPNKYCILQVNNASDQTLYWRYDCNMVSSSGSPGPGEDYSISWVIMGGNSGTSGSDGTSGTDGLGTSGTSGTSGSSGTSGTSGSSGTSGTDGTSGIDGTSGTGGTSGTSGSTAGILVKPAISTLPFTLTILPSPNIYPEYYPVDTSTYAITVILPDASTIADGKIIYIKDEHGSASANPISIDQHLADTIDGSTSALVINTDYGSVTLIKNGGGSWFTL